MWRTCVHTHLFHGIEHIRPCRLHVLCNPFIRVCTERRADIRPFFAPVIWQELINQLLLPTFIINVFHYGLLSKLAGPTPLPCGFPMLLEHQYKLPGIFPSRLWNRACGLFLSRNQSEAYHWSSPRRHAHAPS